jgi:hypothetical protein
MKRLFLLVVLFAVVLSGCTRIWLDHRNYNPKIQQNKYLTYKDKDVLITVYHRSDNSDFAYYYSDSHFRLKYTSHPSVNMFLDSAYQKAFYSAGLRVHRSHPHIRIIPELRIIISALSDETMTLEAQILLDEGIRFAKSYRIIMPYVDSRNQQILEQNAYAMIDESVKTILGDKEFYAAFLQTESDKNINWQPIDQ